MGLSLPIHQIRNRKTQRSDLWVFFLLFLMELLYRFAYGNYSICFSWLQYAKSVVDSIILGWIISYRAIFPVSVQLNHIHPLRQNRNDAKLKSTPTHLYHTKILGYISSNAHKPDKPHNQRTIHDQQHISEKSVLHSFQTDNHRKRHSHSLPRYNRLYNVSPDHPNQITIHSTADKNHITLSCQSGSQYKS